MKKAVLLFIALICIGAVSAQALSFLNLKDAPLTEELLREVDYRNSLVRAYGWLPGTPSALPIAPEVFLEDTPWEFDFAPYIQVTGGTPIDSLQIGWSQSSFFDVTPVAGFPFKLRFTPIPDFFGTKPVWITLYRVNSGGGLSDPVSKGINVTVTNDEDLPTFHFPTYSTEPNVGSGYVYTMQEDTEVGITINFANIVKIYDGSSYNVYITQTVFPFNIEFTATLGNDKSFTFIPNPDYNGTQNFIVTAVENLAGGATQHVSTSFAINVVPVNDPPIIDTYWPTNDPTYAAQTTDITINQDDLTSFGVTASDVDGSIVTEPLFYTWTLEGDLNGVPFSRVESTTSTLDYTVPDLNPFRVPGVYTLTCVVRDRADNSGYSVNHVWNIAVSPDGPVFNPYGSNNLSTFSTTQNVILSTPGVANTTIYYYTTAVPPLVPSIGSLAEPQVYTGPITIPVPPQDYVYTITAWFTHPILPESQHKVQIYNMTGMVATPQFVESTGIHASNVDFPVHITCSTPGATIYYSVDNGLNWILYNAGTGVLLAPQTVHNLVAYAEIAGWDDSAVTAPHTYDIRRQVAFAAPIMDTYPLPDLDGNYCVCLYDSVWVDFTIPATIPADATIYYSINGVVHVYNPADLPLAIYSTSTITWWAEYTASDPDYMPSEVHSFSIPVKNRTRLTMWPNGSVFNPPAGTYSTPQNVFINTLTEPPNAPIYYSIDGGAYQSYNGTAIHVAANTTIEVYADPMPLLTTLPSLHQTAAYVITGTLPSPLIEPVGYPAVAMYEADIIVTISLPVGDPRWAAASIYYTTDGSVPNATSTLYAGPFSLGQGHWQVRAVAILNTWVNSPIALKQYYVKFLPDVTFTPAATDHYTDINVAMFAYDGAQIRYTDDGVTEPHAGSPIYTVPLPLTIDASGRYTTTYRAKAFLAGWVNSDTAEKAYTMIPTVPTPVISANLPGLVHATPIEVSITDALAGVQIYYTIDGSDPDETSIPYIGSFTLTTTTMIRARAYKAGYKESLIAEKNYIVGNNIGTIIFQPVPGTYYDPIDVTISTNPPAAQIYYTTNGDEPTIASTPYVGAIHLNYSPASVTIKALAVLENWTESRGVATYKVTKVLEAPTITPATSQYAAGTNVHVIIEAPDGKIWYSVNGDVPQDYARAFDVSSPISGTITVTAWADVADDSWLTSPTSTAVYTFNGQLNAPIITPVSGTYGDNVTVRMYNYQDATIYYSTDNGVTYNEYTFGLGGFIVDKSSTVKAYASKANWQDSPIVTNVYNLKVPNPVFNPLSNSFALPFTATLTVSSGDPIYYTTDGSNPTLDNVNATRYVNPIDVGYGYTRLRAMAHRADWTSSDIVEVIYNVNGQLQIPVFSLAGGLYYDPQSVTISANPINALIYYTTDGTEPDETSTPYGGAVNITEITTLKAKAYLTGWVPSDVVTESYDLKVKPITSDHLPTVYTSPQTITLTSATPNRDIHYTIDGSVPGLGSLVYSDPIAISATTRIRAIAYKKDGLDWLHSDEFDQTYGISQQVAIPIFNLPGGVYNYAPVPVEITSTPGATISYAYEGEGWQPYTVTLAINETKVVYAKAEIAGWVPSPVVYAQYIISIPTVATPVFDDVAGVYYTPGTYNNAVDVSISTSTPGARIYYTTDGSVPTEIPALLYSAPFTVSSTTTINAKAFKAGSNPSGILTGTYRIEPLTVLSPIVVPEDDTNPFYEPFYVFMYPRTTDSVIHYTTNGDEPTLADSEYVNPFLLNASAVIKAKAFKDGFSSDTVTRDYIITGKVSIAGLTITPAPDNYATLQTISTVGALSPVDAVLHYTTDGSVPTDSSPVFSELHPPLGSVLNLKLRGFKLNWLPSDVLSANYTFTGQVLLAADLFSLDPAPIYTSPQTLTLSTVTTPPGATLRYTLNGADPNELSPAYVAGYNIPITGTTTVKVIGYLSNWLPSDIASVTYNYTGQVTINAPVFTPTQGIYTAAQSVVVNVPTPLDAVVHYTMNGNDPDESSPVYGGALLMPMGVTTTLKVRAYKENWAPSPVYTSVYQMTGQVQLAANVFITAPGTYTSAVNVPLDTTTTPAGATLYYTLDGSEPTLSSTAYSVPIIVSNGTVTIRVRGFKDNWLPSEVAYATYIITGQIEIEAPVFSLASGLYHTPQIVSVNSLTDPVGGTIRYTTNGDEPTIASPVYSTPFILPVGSTLNLKVKAYLTGWEASQTYSASYTVNGTVMIPEPVFSLPSDTYTTPQTVTINAAVPVGASVFYTTDGSDPDETSTPYTGVINVPLGVPMTLKARAYYTDWITSPIYAAYYNMTGQVLLAADLFSLDPAPIYTSPQTLTLSTVTTPPGATLRYTLNGADPNELSPAYVAGYNIPITGTTTVKVIGYLSNWLPSEMASVTYSYTGQVVLGSMSPASGIYQNTETVTLGLPVPNDASVYYTTDGSDPTPASTLYNGAPFSIDANDVINGSPDVTVKVKAFKDDWTESEMLSRTYSFQAGTPQFNIPGGVYPASQTVTLSSITNGAVVHYTLDGTDPDLTSPVYSSAMLISESKTVKARAYNVDYLPSPTASVTYVIGTNQLVALPTFTPPAGTYTTAQSVQINCATPGATIYYRTDGIDPTESDTPFVADIAVPLNSTLTIKARAYKEGFIASQVATATYVVNNKVAAVSFNPAAGNYTNAQQVILTTATEGAYILYTTTIGGVPDMPYTSAIYVPVNSSITITAQAFKDGWAASDIQTATYTITNSTSFLQPLLSPAPGTFTGAQLITIADPVPPTAQVWYTLDGSIPSPSNPNAFQYFGPFMLDGNANLQVTAIADGWDNQVFGNNIYTFNAAMPVYNPTPGYYADPIDVSILSNTSGATIYYTMNGDNPTVASDVYNAPITINGDTTFKAFAWKAGYNPSPIVTGIYGIGGVPIPTVAMPIFDPISGTYSSPRTVSISTSTPGAFIRYTTNGEIPTSSYGQVFNALSPIQLSTDSYTMIRAIAYMEDTSYNPSPVVTSEYTITGQIADVTFNPPAGTYATPQTVFLSSATAGVYFRYTLDGTEPTDMSPLYNTGGIYLAQGSSVVIKAKAYRQGWTTSATGTAVYNVRAISFSLTPAAGTYNNAQSVSVISLNPANADVFYSIDGSNPTIPYTGGISLNGGITDNGIRILRVKATLDTWATTELSQTYIFNTTAPSFAPPAGTYDSARLVSLGSATGDAIIIYTTNGDTPSETVGNVYSVPISVTENMTIRAYAYKPGYITSNVVSATYAIGTVTPVVANPVFNPGTTSSFTPINVSLSTTTGNASIYYTTNGDEPTQASTLYSMPIVVPYNTNMFIKARAYRENWIPSAVISANYVVTGTVADVTFLPGGGTYQTAQNVQLSSTTEGAAIRYTTDGTIPNNTSSPLYTSAIPVPLNTSNMVITAKAFRNGWQDSQTVAQTYNVTGQVVINDPVFSPLPGSFTSAQTISIGTTNPAGAIIRFTMDGTDPTPSSNIYTAGSIVLPMAATTTVKVRAYLATWDPSPVYTAVYTVTGQVELPTNMFDPVSGTYQTPQTVHLTGNTVPAGAILRYTLNGGEPNEFSPAYSAVEGIAINGSATLRVKGFLTGWIPSETSMATYTITGQVVFNPPVFTPAAGAYTTAQSVQIGTTTPANAVCRYTVDGTEPTITSPVYSIDNPILTPLGMVTTVKVKAYLDDWTPSVTQTAVYNVTGQVLMTDPVFSPNPDMYTTPIAVSINTATSPSDATVRYTIDGSDPNETSTPYTMPIQVAANQSITIRTRAFKDGWLPSVITTGVYNVTGQVLITGTVFTPDPSIIYTTAQNVVISNTTNTLGAVVRYTTDGNEPGETSPIYETPIALGLNTVTEIKVKAFKTGWTSSPTYSAIYTITGQVNIAGVAITPVSGTYQTAQTITTTGSLVPNDAVLRYTTDGTDPIATSPLFTNLTPPLASTLNLKLRGFKANWVPSAVISASYTFTGQVVLTTPMFNPAAGTYNNATSVTLNTVTVPVGATLRYTLNGIDPTESSPAYSAAIAMPMNATTTLKVRGFLAGWTPSIVLSAQYIMTGALDIATPTFAPAAGQYYIAQNVSLGNAIILGTATVVSDATIRYTTDTTEPTATSAVYNPASPIVIANSTTLKIKAFKTNWISSPTYTAIYTITGQVSIAGISVTPAAGTYQTVQTINASGSLMPNDASLRFTTDGSDPTVTSPLFASFVSPMNSTFTLKLRGFKTDWLPSPIMSINYNFTGQVQITTAVFTPESGIYTSAQNVIISTTTNTLGAVIHYTTDGNEPTEASLIYTQPIPLELASVTTIKAKAFKTDWTTSETYTANYIITGKVSFTGQLFNLDPSTTYTTAQSAQISAGVNPEAATIRYTTDGNDPTGISDVYTPDLNISLPLNTTTTIKAKAFHPNWIDSDVISATYRITGQVALSPTPFDPIPGTYTTQPSITVAAAQLPSSGVIIRYTLDGTEPTISSPAYVNPIVLPMAAITNIKLKGFADGWIPSEVVTGVYNITGTVATPAFSHPGNVTYGAGFKLGISCATPGATIRYTMDGTDVTATSPIYADSLSIEGIRQNWVVKAQAFLTNWVDSAQNSANYTLLLSPINVWTEVYDTHIRVLWNMPNVTRALDGFNVYRKRDIESGFPIAPLNAAPVNDKIGGNYYYDDYAIKNNVIYQYMVKAVYNGVESPPSNIDDGQLISSELVISESSNAYPNPAETNTTIKVVLSRNDNVQLAVSIYDFAGKKVRTLSVPSTVTNKVEIVWDLKNSSGTKVGRGTYFARVVVSESTNRFEKVIKIAVK